MSSTTRIFIMGEWSDGTKVAWERFPELVPSAQALTADAMNEVVHARDYKCYHGQLHRFDAEGNITEITYSGWTCVPNDGGESIIVDSTGWEHAKRYQLLAEAVDAEVGKTGLILIVP